MKKEDKNKQLPFTLPENYFDDFSAKINTQIKLVEQEEKTTKSVTQILKPMLLMAASFAIIFSLVYFPVKIYMNSNEKLQNKTIVSNNYIINEASTYEFNEEWTDAEIEEYIISTNIDDYELYSAIIY